MKKFILSSILVIAVISVSIAQKTSFRIKGSDTCLPLVQKEAETYMKNNKNSSITVVGGGSGVGIASLISGHTEVAMASRKVKMGEMLQLKNEGKPYKEVVFAMDALAVVVNSSNKINQLTREQLEGIFTGKIRNWKEVGGDNMAIVVYSRETSSGTYEFFKEHVLKNKNYYAKALMMPATGAIIQSVSQTRGAIGYVGLAYVEKNVKALKVSFDGKTFVLPGIQTAKNKTYPISRPLQFYYLASAEKSVNPFIQFVLSAEGQKIVSQVGYVPIK